MRYFKAKSNMATESAEFSNVTKIVNPSQLIHGPSTDRLLNEGSVEAVIETKTEKVDQDETKTANSHGDSSSSTTISGFSGNSLKSDPEIKISSSVKYMRPAKEEPQRSRSYRNALTVDKPEAAKESRRPVEEDKVSTKSTYGDSAISLCENTQIIPESSFDTSSNTAATVLTMVTASATRTRLTMRHVHTCNERRRHFEDNLAVIFMVFVLVFLICHVPRLLLNIHELMTIKEAMACIKMGERPFSLWSMITICISHFLLVINSSTNILVYCLMSPKFREEYRDICRSLIPRWTFVRSLRNCFCCRCNNKHSPKAIFDERPHPRRRPSFQASNPTLENASKYSTTKI